MGMVEAMACKTLHLTEMGMGYENKPHVLKPIGFQEGQGSKLTMNLA